MEWTVWINFYILIALMPDPFNIESHPGWKESVRSNLNPIAHPLLAFFLGSISDREPFPEPGNDIFVPCVLGKRAYLEIYFYGKTTAHRV